MKSTLRALSLGASMLSAAMVVAPSAEARILIDALGGEVKLEGYLSSEARANVGNGDAYLNQWIQRFELNAEVNYEDVGVFDTLSFVTVIRPEFDAAYYYGDSIGHGTARNAGGTSYMGDTFTYDNSPREFGGFDIYQNVRFGGVNFGGGANNAIGDVNRATGTHFATVGRPLNMTGGLSKVVVNGFENPSWLTNNFESILNRAPGGGKYSPNNARLGGFSGAGVTSQMELNCIRCYDLDDDPLDVAMNNTGSSGRLYPFRELYVDATMGDWWFRVGKQQIVWGKTDFFRLQDLVNPVDFGQHFFLDSFEDIRIPQWIMSIQRKFGDIGPTTDNAVQLIWNFDEFKGIGLGAPNAAWGHPFAKEKSTFAAFNEYFSVEPCVSAATAIANGMGARDVCGSKGKGDRRKPSGFGQPVGLSYEDRPEWKIENTEPGIRWKFRVGEFHVAISEFYGWNDVPVFRFHSVNVPNGALGLAAPGYGQAGPAGPGKQDWLVYDLVCARNAAAPGCVTPRSGSGGVSPIAANISGATPGVIPIRVMSPKDALNAYAQGAANPQLAQLARTALANNNAADFWFASGLPGGQTDIQYKQASTTGLSFDWFEAELRRGVPHRVLDHPRRTREQHPSPGLDRQQRHHEVVYRSRPSDLHSLAEQGPHVLPVDADLRHVDDGS